MWWILMCWCILPPPQVSRPMADEQWLTIDVGGMLREGSTSLWGDRHCPGGANCTRNIASLDNTCQNWQHIITMDVGIGSADGLPDQTRFRRGPIGDELTRMNRSYQHAARSTRRWESMRVGAHDSDERRR